MLKKNKNILILTLLATLLPVFIGLLLWKRLPETLPTHFNFQGVADGWSSKGFAVFGFPLMLTGVHCITIAACMLDPKNKNANDKVLRVVLWMIPIISSIITSCIYAISLGANISVTWITFFLVGILFICIGNYLPKCRQNFTIGIKIPWTLNNEDNWNRTHRFAGPVWMLGGGLMMFLPIFSSIWIFLIICLVLTLLPIIYSYLYYLKQEKGTA